MSNRFYFIVFPLAFALSAFVADHNDAPRPAFRDVCAFDSLLCDSTLRWMDCTISEATESERSEKNTGQVYVSVQNFQDVILKDSALFRHILNFEFNTADTSFDRRVREEFSDLFSSNPGTIQSAKDSLMYILIVMDRIHAQDIYKQSARTQTSDSRLVAFSDIMEGVRIIEVCPSIKDAKGNTRRGYKQVWYFVRYDEHNNEHPEILYVKAQCIKIN